MEHVYWNPTMETMPREQLRALQDERLRDVVRRVYEHVPFYRNKMQQLGITPNDIHGVEDLHLLPFTEKKDLRNNYPFGLFAVPQSEIVRIHASSGTTGKPSVAGYTSGDIDRWAELMHVPCTAPTSARTISCRWPMATACLPAGWARTTARSA